jgi:HSP20 family protein
MAKAEWDPLKELVGVQERMNKLFESALAKTNFDADGGVGAWAPVTDVYETPERFVLCLELPGLDQNDIDLRMDGDELVVQGERRMEREQPGEQFHRVERSYGRFVRRFPIPSTVDRGSVDAQYRTGVLRVALRKRGEGQQKPVRVAIR